MAEEENEEEVTNVANVTSLLTEEEDFMTAEPLDDSCLSDSEDEAEIFDPMPYAFILKDVYRKPLLLSPEKLYNAKISCPSYHVLLDHVVAVLWCFYSKTGHHKLGTAQLHWTIKFLEGLVDSKNKSTADVSMAIEHLEEALVQIGASVDETTLKDRIYDDDLDTSKPPMNFTMTEERRGTYEDFESDLLEARKGDLQIATIVEGGGGEQTGEAGQNFVQITTRTRTTSGTSERVESPSIIINDMFGDKQNELAQLLDNTMRNPEDENLAGTKSAGQIESSTSLAENYVSFRNDLIDKTIRQLEQIKNLDETLNALKCQPNSEELAKLKETIKNSK